MSEYIIGGDSMKMNPECIRDILFTVEESSTYEHACYLYYSQFDKLSKYDKDTILYHARICTMYGYIFTPTEYQNNPKSELHVDLTPAGHEFLSNVRSDSVWKNTVKVAGKIGSVSLDMLSKISANILTELIKQCMEQPINF